MRKWLLAGVLTLAGARMAAAGVETDLRPVQYEAVSATTVSVSGTAMLSSVTIAATAYLWTIDVVYDATWYVDSKVAYGLMTFTRTHDGTVLADGYATLNDRIFDLLERVGYDDRGTGVAPWRYESLLKTPTFFLVNPPLRHLPSGDVTVPVKYRIRCWQRRSWSGPQQTTTQSNAGRSVTTTP